jgi:hypothetical protein
VNATWWGDGGGREEGRIWCAVSANIFNFIVMDFGIAPEKSLDRLEGI